MTRAVVVTLLFTGLALAGCTADSAGDLPPPDGTIAPSPPPSQGATAGFVLTIDAMAPTLESAATVTGTVSRAVLLSIAVDGTPTVSDQAEGPWSFEVPLAYGQNVVMVSADDGDTTVQDAVTVVRLATATMAASFAGSVPPREDRAASISYDTDTFASTALYADCSFQHPGFYTVMDAMVEWQDQTDVTIQYTECGDNGYFVNSIDDYERPDFWCYTRNEESDVLGASLEPFDPDDALFWGGCSGIL